MKSLLFVILMFGASHAAMAACDQIASPSSNLPAMVKVAPNGSTICLNSGNYGTVDLFDINRSGYVTLESASGKTATISPRVGNSKYIRLSNLTITGALQNSCSRNIDWLDNAVTGTITLTNSGCSGSLATLFDGNAFGAINAGGSYEGRLSLIYGSGIIVRNNTFGPGGASDGVFMGGNVSNVTIGPGNVFTGILQSKCGSVHCDSVQGYGAGSGISIEGNLFKNGDTFIMMPDGSKGVAVRNNVFDGAGASYIDKIQFGSASSPVFQHNTLINLRASFDSKTGSSATSNALVENNLLAGGSSFKTANGSGCTGCAFRNNLSGTPTFVGGPNPATLAGFQLTASSIGYRAASDGTNMGANVDGASTPIEVLLAPPTGLNVK